MNIAIDRLNNQDGSIILIAMLLITLLTIVGVNSIDNAVMESRIATNDQVKKISFYHADGASYVAAKMVRHVLGEGSAVAQGNLGGVVEYTDTVEGADSFYDQMMGYEAYDDGLADINWNIPLTGGSVRADVRRLGARHLTGGGAEFAAGAEGIGAAGGGIISYGLVTEGTAPRNATSAVAVTYGYVVGVVGGI